MVVSGENLTGPQGGLLLSDLVLVQLAWPIMCEWSFVLPTCHFPCVNTVLVSSYNIKKKKKKRLCPGQHLAIC